MMKRKSRAAKASPLPAEAQDRLPVVSLTLTRETLWLTRYDPRGRAEVTYPVSVRDAANALRGFDGLKTGLLPEGALFWERHRLAIYLPPARRAISFLIGKKTRRLSVPMPGFVLVGAGKRYSIFACKERPASPKAALFKAPLPNVNNSGVICQGTVQFPKCSPATIHAAAQTFFESYFNDDLSMEKVRAQQHDDTSLRHWLATLERRREFPADQLVRFGKLSELMSHGALDGDDDGEWVAAPVDIDDWPEDAGEIDPYEYAYGETEAEDVEAG